MLDTRLWKDGVTDCEMWDGHRHGFWKICYVKYVVSCYMLCYIIMKYVMGKEKFQICKASKLSHVVPIHTRSGLDHGLNMIAFK